MACTENLVEYDYLLVSRLNKVKKNLLGLEMKYNLSYMVRVQLAEAIEQIEDIILKETKKPKPALNRLGIKLNEALIKNPYGDGVVLRVFKKRDGKIEKCTILNFIISEE